MVSLAWQRLFLAISIGLGAVDTAYGSGLSPRACTRTVKAKQGDTCASIANAQGITVSEFLLNNPTISGCDLTAGSDYCVAGDGNGGGAASPSPTPSLVISSDGTCGSGVTCAGSKWGTCCSEHGYCGSTNDYCTGGCQPAFGSCGAVSSSTPSGPITSAPAGTGTVIVTSTTIITSTAVTSLTRTTTIAVPATVTSVVLTTSTVTRTASSVVTSTSLVLATSTSVVLETSTRVLTSTALVTRTSLVIGTATQTVTVTAERTAATTTITIGACSPTKPDTPITRTTTSRGQTQTPSSAPTPLFPGTISSCKKYYQIRDQDTCDSIVGRTGITFAQFYAWNPSVSCDDLWTSYYVCVGA